MKIIILTLLIVSSVAVRGQGVVGTLGDIADVAGLVAMTADVVDNTLMTGDKIVIINQELERTQQLLNNPDFMRYTSTYGKNKALREVRMHSRQVQIYATTMKNLINMLTRLSAQITATKAEDMENLIAKVVAKVASAASGTSIFGTKFGGGEDANTVAQLQENMTGEKKNSFQQMVLNLILELDAFNQGVDKLHRDIVNSQSALYRSYGTGVLMNSTSMNLYSYKAAYEAKELQTIKRASEQNAAQRKQTNDAIKKMSEEFVKTANESEEYQKKLSSLK